MLEIKQLKIFTTIVDVGTFTGAGEKLGLSQPAISQQVRALEETLGVALLVRDGRGARPTPAGDRLFQCARHVLGRLEEVEHGFAEETNGRRGIVRLGAPEPACSYLLPGALAVLRRELPKIELQVTSGEPAAVLPRLGAGDLDLALVALPFDSGRARVVEVGQDELVAITPPQHPWVGRGRVLAGDFETQPLVLYDRKSPITDATLAFLLEGGVFPTVAIEIDQLEGVKGLVQAGVGVAVVPRWAARRELAAGALGAASLGETGLQRTWALAFSDELPRPATIAAVVRLLGNDLPSRLA